MKKKCSKLSIKISEKMLRKCWEKTKRFQKNDSERYQNPFEKEKNKKYKQYKNLSEEKKTPLWLQTI